MNTAFLKSFSTLKAIYDEKAFSSIALNKTLNGCKSQDKALITKIVYGVLDNDIKLTYIIGKYVRKLPHNDALIVLKIGTYCLAELNVPAYAVVNDCAELAKVTGDVHIVGFVNATLKNISRSVKSFDDFPTDEAERLSVLYSYPLWAVKKLQKDYGAETAREIVSFKRQNYSVVRTVDCNIADFFEEFLPTCFDDAYKVLGNIPSSGGAFAVQSLSSMAVARAVANIAENNVLDCCSAPGGKAVYIKRLLPDAKVVACDIHPHRVELINSYAKRMGVDVETHCCDMTEYVSEWEQAFDTVLCDVPCSGFGVVDTRPDIKIFRQNKDISDLMKVQYAILDNCANYVEVGGNLLYSTCTIFDNENGQNIRKFLKEHPNFKFGAIKIPELPQTCGKGEYQFLPQKDDGMQGFYLAVLKRLN